MIENTYSGPCCELGEYDNIEKNNRWFIKNAGSENITEMEIRSEKLKKSYKKCTYEKVYKRNAEIVRRF